ncbi:MAG: hypothetical protein LCH37_02775 [Bacteroidetes bacterium]|nr:hypothetical protein [Bacteroidota bacterium]
MEALKITKSSSTNQLIIDLPNNFVSKKLEIIILPVDEPQNDWTTQQINTLNKAYSTDEPEYDLLMIKEPNTDYEKR